MSLERILAIDCGTTSTRAILFDASGAPLHSRQLEIASFCNSQGWVEQDADEIWASTLQVCKDVLRDARMTSQDVVAIGVTNQRETTVLWDKRTGSPIARAIVWQDRRTSSRCESLKAKGQQDIVAAKTGLPIDPYFSATKIDWLLQNVPAATDVLDRGDLLFGTIDTWLVWKLTGGRTHATDASNASRTLLFNIHQQKWDEDLLNLFKVPDCILPEVRDSAADFGSTEASLFGSPIPIRGIIGDQQAALVGQACTRPGMLKSTYGTGCFLVMNTGETAVASKNKLLTTVAYRIRGHTTYAIEGSIFVAGSAIQWLRDNLRAMDCASDSEALAQASNSESNVYFVPAFTGLGAPYWDPDARGAIVGLTRDTGINEIVAAGLQAACYQTLDLVESMRSDGAEMPISIRIDGGMVANNWFSQRLSNILQVRVDRPEFIETTALGAAYMAALGAGTIDSIDRVQDLWRGEQSFFPQVPPEAAQRMHEGWRKAIRVLTGSSQ